LNDGMANAIRKQRMNYIEAHGVVEEMDLPDVKTRRRMEMARALAGKG